MHRNAPAPELDANLRRAFLGERQKRCLDDLHELVPVRGAEVVGAAAIIDRSGGAITFGVPHKTVIQLALPMYGPDECPLCKQGLPVTKPGSRPT